MLCVKILDSTHLKEELVKTLSIKIYRYEGMIEKKLNFSGLTYPRDQEGEGHADSQKYVYTEFYRVCNQYMSQRQGFHQPWCASDKGR